MVKFFESCVRGSGESEGSMESREERTAIVGLVSTFRMHLRISIIKTVNSNRAALGS